MIFKRLRWKITVSYIAVVILSMFILGTYLLNSLDDYFYHSIEKRLTTQALLAAKLVAAQNGHLDTNGLDQLAKQISQDVQARVTIISSTELCLVIQSETLGQWRITLTGPKFRLPGIKAPEPPFATAKPWTPI